MPPIELTTKVQDWVTLHPPVGALQTLAEDERDFLVHSSQNGDSKTLRNCVLAVLNAGSKSDDIKGLFEAFDDFEFKVQPSHRGIKVKLRNAPASAFNLNGQIIPGIQEHIYAVFRDMIFAKFQIGDMKTPKEISNGVFKTVRNAGVLQENDPAKMRPRVFYWGGHSISKPEKGHAKSVGYNYGIEGCEIDTGCGDGIMKAPMKGAALGHLKLRLQNPLYIGLTEPGIIGAEPPNAMINPLIILQDIEKRLEAFMRLSHGGNLGPGGVGTTEELLTFIGIMMAEENHGHPYPMVLTGPRESEHYFELLDNFIRNTLGEPAQKLYKIIIGNPKEVVRHMVSSLKEVTEYRLDNNEPLNWNRSLHIPYDFQKPFIPTHANVAQLKLTHTIARHELVANLRRMFSAIVAGNVKASGIQAIQEHGKLQINASPEIMKEIDILLTAFVNENRMKVGQYDPCYQIVTNQQTA